MRGRWLRRILVILVLGAGVTGVPAVAQAGQWVQVSCVNPDGSASTNQGWAASSASASYGSNAITSCGPGSPMTAYLSDQAAAPVNAYELLTYTPPAGSSLAGGTINVSGSAGGLDPSGSNGTGTSVVYSPQFVYDGSNVLYQCSRQGCQNPNLTYSTPVTLNPNEGGDLYLQAGCGGAAGYSCAANSADTGGTLSQISLSSADLLLSNSSVPAASGFSGTLLGTSPPSSASLLFTATDQNGPGVYTVTVKIDGTSVYSATPNTNNGQCASVGTLSGTGALEFDAAQPCPQEESVDVPVSTAGLAPGNHEVIVAVTDAAGNASTVLDQEITIPSPAPTTTSTSSSTSMTTTSAGPARKGAVRVRFVLNAHFRGSRSKLLEAKILDLPAAAMIRVSDSGPHHPKLKLTRAPARHAKRLLRALTQLTFHPGDKLLFTVSAPGKRPERLQLTFRDARKPVATLLDTYTQKLTTPRPARHAGAAAVRARFRIRARYNSTASRLLSLRPLDLPPHASVSVRDRGPHSPLLTPARAHGPHLATLLRALTRVSFVPGDRLFITVAAPGRRREQVELLFRNGEAPRARLL
jgi:hypothetical protein